MSSTVLVTGADGFIGSHLTELLSASGHKVRALCQYNSFNSWGWLESVECLDDIEVLSGDVRDPNFCKMMTKGVNRVYHLAALIAIPYSYTAPASYVDTNITGTLNICQAALENGVECLVQTSTSEVYGTAQYVPIDESHPLQPQSPYSASKIASDAMAMSFYNSFDLPVIIARPFNCFGPRQSARAVIPTVITQIASGQDEIRLGDLSPTRDFNYVTDTCRGLVALSECNDAFGETVNIGSGKEYSIGDAVEMIKKSMNSNINIVTDASRMRPEKSEVMRLCCDNTRLRELTGFVYEHSFEKGLEMTIDWFTDKGNLRHYKADIYNI